MLKCMHCKKEFDETNLTFIRCPNCDNKILFKITPPIAHRVKAI